MAVKGQIMGLLSRKKMLPSLTDTQEAVKETLVITASTLAATLSICGLKAESFHPSLYESLV